MEKNFSKFSKEAGAVLVEAALGLPVLLLVLFGIVSMSQLFISQITLERAVYSAASWGVRQDPAVPWDWAGGFNAVFDQRIGEGRGFWQGAPSVGTLISTSPMFSGQDVRFLEVVGTAELDCFLCRFTMGLVGNPRIQAAFAAPFEMQPAP